MLRASLSPPSRLFWRRVFVAPVCLCAVAALHLYRVSACRQTPWKGGGFGMFSTVESEDSRFLRCWKVATHQPVAQAKDTPGARGDREFDSRSPIVVPKHLSREELRVRVAPTPERLTRLADLLAETAESPVVVEVWQYHFDAATGKLVAEQRDEVRTTPAAKRGTP